MLCGKISLRIRCAAADRREGLDNIFGLKALARRIRRTRPDDDKDVASRHQRRAFVYVRVLSEGPSSIFAPLRT